MHFDEFSIDPINDVFIDPYDFFKESEEDNILIANYIKEASTDVSKKNIFQKIWNLIKRLFSFIVKTISRIFKFIISFFKSGKKKTANQCAEEANIKPMEMSKSNIQKKILSDPNITVTYHSDKNKLSSNKVNVQIPSNPNSTIQIDPTINMAFQQIKVKYDHDQWQFVVDTNPLVANSQIPIRGHKGYYGTYLILAYTLMKYVKDNGKENPISLIEKFCNMVNEINDIFKNNSISDKNDASYKKLYKLMDEIVEIDQKASTKLEADIKFYKDKAYNDKLTLVFKMNELSNVIEQLRKVSDLVANLDIEVFLQNIEFINNKFSINIFRNKYTTNDILKFFNNLANYLNCVSMGMNSITDNLSQVYTISCDYYETCSDKEKLSQFVELMVKGNIPPKYVMYNIYLISDKSLKGYQTKNAPIWGQSRVCFIPDNSDVVHKIAYNSLGYRANKDEQRIFNIFKKAKKDYILAPIEYVSKNEYIIDLKKVNDVGTVTENELKNITDEFNKIIEEINNDPKFMRKLLIEDIHKGNVGKINNRWVIIDYAM